MYILLNKPNSVVDMIDFNDRAIKLTKMRLKKNHIIGEVFNSDTYQNVNIIKLFVKKLKN